jgi:hypothetical protein
MQNHRRGRVRLSRRGRNLANGDEIVSNRDENEELVISFYSRADAIAEGVLVEAPASMIKELGFKYPIALTRAVWDRYWPDPIGWSGFSLNA